MATDAIGSDAVHIPVMRARILDLLAVVLKSGRRVHVDGTLGMGGHAEAVLRRFPDVELVGIDRDQQALTMAEARLEPFADRVHLVHAVHDELPEVLDDLGLDYVDSVLLDLGLSSFQIDEVERGFSYSVDSPLDMRMDQSSGRTAAQILNESDPGALVRMLREYGEEKFADRIVRAIVTERDRQPIETSGRLVEIITEAIPATVRSKDLRDGLRRSGCLLLLFTSHRHPLVNAVAGDHPRVHKNQYRRLGLRHHNAIAIGELASVGLKSVGVLHPRRRRRRIRRRLDRLQLQSTAS